MRNPQVSSIPGPHVWTSVQDADCLWTGWILLSAIVLIFRFLFWAEPFKHKQSESTHRPAVYLLVQDQSSGGLTGRRRGSTGTVYSRSLLNRGNNHHSIVKHSKRDQMFGAEEPLVALCLGSSDKHVQQTAVTFLCVSVCVCACSRLRKRTPNDQPRLQAKAQLSLKIGSISSQSI